MEPLASNGALLVGRLRLGNRTAAQAIVQKHSQMLWRTARGAVCLRKLGHRLRGSASHPFDRPSLPAADRERPGPLTRAAPTHVLTPKPALFDLAQ